MSQSPKVREKRLLKQDNYGSASIPNASIPKLRRCRIDSVRNFPRFCGPFGSQDEDGSNGFSSDAVTLIPLRSVLPKYVHSDGADHSPITPMKPYSDLTLGGSRSKRSHDDTGNSKESPYEAMQILNVEDKIHPTCANFGSDFGTMSMNDSEESTCKSVSNGDDCDIDDDCLIIDEKSSTSLNVKALNNNQYVHSSASSGSSSQHDQVKVSKTWEFEWVEVENSEVEVDDGISFVSPSEWQNLTHTRENRVDLPNNLGKERKHLTKVNEFPYDADRDIGSRNKVQEVLKDYHEQCTKLSLENEEEPEGPGNKQVHIKSAMILKKANKWLNREQIFGHVPGVKIGDQFQFRAELVVVGLHHEFISGISHATMGDTIYALSIVDSGRYENKVKSSNVLIYSGQGGNPKVQCKRHSKDQILERGNLALKNSMDAKYPVRVIRKVEVEGKKKIYFYDGLYNVMKFWPYRSETCNVVYKFQMVRVEGQPECDHFNISKERVSIAPVESKAVILDLSEGKEKYPIMVVNDFSDEKPGAFKYISEMFFTCLQEHPIPSGCDCIGGCSDLHQCICVIKNGREVPFNEEGAILRAKKKIYECGPSCKCPPSCQNRVSQHGPKLPLEVFKTRSIGWGVRSREEIQSGSFICEYLGELVEAMEADHRANDEYLFDLDDGTGFTIDAAKYGNVSRFINHSCSPNLYAQNVLYDHEDKKVPHVMFFAAKRIPALQELTYDYNYKLNSVRDANGNIKQKTCCCGSRCCTGRLY